MAVPSAGPPLSRGGVTCGGSPTHTGREREGVGTKVTEVRGGFHNQPETDNGKE